LSYLGKVRHGAPLLCVRAAWSAPCPFAHIILYFWPADKDICWSQRLEHPDQQVGLGHGILIGSSVYHGSVRVALEVY
jgi:hypothetical protein